VNIQSRFGPEIGATWEVPDGPRYQITFADGELYIPIQEIEYAFDVFLSAPTCAP